MLIPSHFASTGHIFSITENVHLPFVVSGHPESPLLSDSEDENPEALQDAHSSGSLNHYSLCEQPQTDLLLPATPPPSPRHRSVMDAVVISQPAPLSSPHQPSAHTHSHSSESVRVCCHQSYRSEHIHKSKLDKR